MYKLLFIYFILCGSILASVINIPADLPAIQAGIDSAQTGDTVLVQPGTYVENINFNGKNITVASLFLITGDTSYISNTIIDGDNNGSVVRFANGENKNAIITGFTLQKGSGTRLSHPTLFYYGGGVFCYYANPTLDYIIIRDNYTTDGGGIYCENSSMRIGNSIIENNIASSTIANIGGGLFLKDSNVELTNVIIRKNNTWVAGGGIICVDSEVLLTNVVIEKNYCHNEGGGIASSSSNIILINVTIYGNITDNVGGGLSIRDSSNLFVLNSILWNNVAQQIHYSEWYSQNSCVISHSNIHFGINGITTNNNGTINWLNGNIDADPFFRDTGNGDFSLLPNSPCIDAGIQDTFLVYNNGLDTLFVPPMNYLGSAPDMGAYEFDPATSISHYEIQPIKFILYQNYPNPFNPSTTIKYDLPKTEKVVLKIFNSLGQQVKTLVNEIQQAGNKSVIWDGKNVLGQQVSSGVYFYSISAGKFYQVRKMLLLR